MLCLRQLMLHLTLLINEHLVFILILLNDQTLLLRLLLKPVMILRSHLFKADVIMFGGVDELIKAGFDQIIRLLSRLHIISSQYILPPLLIKIKQRRIWMANFYLLNFFNFLFGKFHLVGDLFYLVVDGVELLGVGAAGLAVGAGVGVGCTEALEFWYWLGFECF